MAEKPNYLAHCREIIEKKLAWDSSESWQNHDFETLRIRIFEETKVMLSSSTLKRIWGKVRYDSTPNRATLNVLAQFAGYRNWREFTATDLGPTLQPQIENVGKPLFKISYKIPLAVAGIVFLMILIGFVVKKNQILPLRFEKVQFASQPVTSGLPNTVIFQYDATHSNADSVFIQQSWDKNKRYKVAKDLHEYTSTYYYPGYYRAKLILNDSIVKEHDIYIETDGWVGLIEKDPIPVYLPKELFEKQLELTKEELSKLKIDYLKEAPIFSLTNVNKSIDIVSDHFILQAVLQNTYNESNAICQYTSIAVLGTTGVINIPLCKIGCIGEIGLLLGMDYIDGKTHDLSGFGVDFSKDVKIKCETKNQIITVSVNDKVAYTASFDENIGTIVGTQIKFNGTGLVRQFALKENKY